MYFVRKKITGSHPAHILHRKRKLHRKGAPFNYSSALYQTLQDNITFRPLAPSLKAKIYLIWKKYQVFTPIADRFLDEVKKHFIIK